MAAPGSPDAVSGDGRRHPPSPRIEIRSPGASPEEASAIAAAIEEFLRETAPRPPAGPSRSAWSRAGLLEGVGLAPAGPRPWVPASPWSQRGR